MPNGEFGKCEFLNDVPIEELKSALKTHKEFIKSRFNSGDGKEAYVDAGDLGVDPKKYANGNTNGDSASSLKTNGLDKTEKAAVKAGGVPVNGHVVNGVSHSLSIMDEADDRPTVTPSRLTSALVNERAGKECVYHISYDEKRREV